MVGRGFPGASDIINELKERTMLRNLDKEEVARVHGAFGLEDICSIVGSVVGGTLAGPGGAIVGGVDGGLICQCITDQSYAVEVGQNLLNAE